MVDIFVKITVDTTPAPTVRLSAAHQRCLRKSLKIVHWDYFSNVFPHHGLIRKAARTENKKDAEASFLMIGV